jgi:hypothetical protein
LRVLVGCVVITSTQQQQQQLMDEEDDEEEELLREREQSLRKLEVCEHSLSEILYLMLRHKLSKQVSKVHSFIKRLTVQRHE